RPSSMMTEDTVRVTATMELNTTVSSIHAMIAAMMPATADGAASGLMTFVLPLISVSQPHEDPVNQVTAASTATRIAAIAAPNATPAGRRRSTEAHPSTGSFRVTAIHDMNGSAMTAVAFSDTATPMSTAATTA